MSTILKNGKFNVTFNKRGNNKVGHKVWTFSTLKGNENIHTEYRGHVLDVVGTCGENCAICSKKCYVNSSYRYSSVKFGQSVNTLALRESVYSVYKQLYGQLARAKKLPRYVRIHVSGEFEDVEELHMWNALAREFPSVIFYTYSKAYKILREFLTSNASMSHNFIINVSVWHHSGISFYNEFHHLPNVRAFAYDDGGFDYTVAGLINASACNHCTAYETPNHRMNHSISCATCGMCARCGVKVTLCKDH